MNPQAWMDNISGYMIAFQDLPTYSSCDLS